MQARQPDKYIFAILTLALVIRLVGIATRPIWYDEAFSILFAETGIQAMLSGTLTTVDGNAAEEHPLGYYTLLWLWIKTFGESVVAVRLLSVVAGLISVYLVYCIALEALSKINTARLSMLFAALSPFQIHYAQEIRMYSFMTMWLLLATYAYQRGSRSGSWKWWLVFSVSAALAQYTHNLAAFYLVSLALLPVFQKDWKTLRAVTFAGIGALMIYFPWLVQLPAQFSKIQNAYWIERPGISEVLTLLIVFTANTPVPTQWIAVVLAIAFIVVGVGVIQTARQARIAPARSSLWIFYLAFAPVLLLLLFSQWRPVYIERALLPSGAIFCIWLVWVITQTNLSKIAQSTLLVLLGITYSLGIYQHVAYHDFPYGPFQELDASLRERVAPDDIILHSNKLSLLPALVFDRQLPHAFIGDLPGSRTDTLAPATQHALGIRAEPDVRSATREARRVWYVVFERSIAEYRAAGYETHPDIEFLDSQLHLQSKEDWDGIQILLYTREP